MATKDSVLVKRILSGERETFDALVRRYIGLVHGVIFQKVRRPDEVEDLVQDVFCKAYEELPTLRDPDKFAPWLARMAANQAQTWLRQRRLQQAYKGGEKYSLLVDESKPPDAQLESHEARKVIWAALDQLRPEYRQILLLFHFENCRQRDIARFLNISLPTVK
ncbi:MAG: sigma-70 family RNA polymerase sigma factor [Candidatus Latescibacteria bacterium]|nr:sigma-70 family RNA polymerase sigma factor [Candidatus Latescibacterota bacterium]